MRKEAAAILLMVVTAAVALTSGSSPIGSSRFLAGALTCDVDPSVCSSPGTTCCGRSCADTKTDPLNCGKCGNVCQFTDSCCGGSCTDLAYNRKHCGSCNNQCTKRCFYGMCDYA